MNKFWLLLVEPSGCVLFLGKYFGNYSRNLCDLIKNFNRFKRSSVALSGEEYELCRFFIYHRDQHFKFVSVSIQIYKISESWTVLSTFRVSYFKFANCFRLLPTVLLTFEDELMYACIILEQTVLMDKIISLQKSFWRNYFLNQKT